MCFFSSASAQRMEFFEACIAVESSSFGSPDCAMAEHKPRTMKEQISSSCLTEPRYNSCRVPARSLRTQRLTPTDTRRGLRRKMPASSTITIDDIKAMHPSTPVCDRKFGQMWIYRRNTRF